MHGVGRFRILVVEGGGGGGRGGGGARLFRILGGGAKWGPNSQQVHDVILTSQ